MGFPEEVSYGAAKAAQVNYTMSAALELAPHGITANMVHPPVTDTGWVTAKVREAVAANGPDPRRRTGRRCRRHRLPDLGCRRLDHRQRHNPPLTAAPAGPTVPLGVGGMRRRGRPRALMLARVLVFCGSARRTVWKV